jgi:hypothetical protein
MIDIRREGYMLISQMSGEVSEVLKKEERKGWPNVV